MKPFSKSTAGVFVGLLLGAALLAPFHFTSFAKDSSPPPVNIDASPIARDSRGVTSFAPIVKKAAPSVVNIYSTRIVRERGFNPFQNFQNDPIFRQFFGDQFDNRERIRREQSLGSGVIVTADGYILTANHVVRGADEVKVAIGENDNKKFTARIVGTDPQTDVAVLKIDATGLPAVTLGDSSQLETGDIVLAIGNPFGIGQTVTMGIISALGRHGYGINGPSGYENFIQTDAAINPGNSGGALIDAQGRLIGINTWIASSSGGSEGVGFAVPVNMARRVMESLISGGKVARGYLGIHPQEVTPELAKAFNLGNQPGALVGGVFPNTPAAKAGMKSGDFIVEFNGKPVTDAHTLTLMVSDCAPGAEAAVKVIRKGQPKTLTVKLGELPGQAARDDDAQAGSTADTDALDGVTVTDLDPQTRQQLKIPDDVAGALVTNVKEDTNAGDAGLQKNDIIVEVNQQAVNNSADAIKLCTQAKGDQILITVWRRVGDFASTSYLTVDNTKRGKK